MGKGKGERNFWECIVKKGHVILEIGNVNNLNNKNIKYGLKLVSDRLSFKTKLIKVTY
jgi:ribosomal protein L16/L10AE